MATLGGGEMLNIIWIVLITLVLIFVSCIILSLCYIIFAAAKITADKMKKGGADREND